MCILAPYAAIPHTVHIHVYAAVHVLSVCVCVGGGGGGGGKERMFLCLAAKDTFLKFCQISTGTITVCAI